MEFNAKLDNLNSVLAYVESELEKIDAPMKETMQITIAVEEMFVNIAHYAYEEDDIGGFSDISVVPVNNGARIVFMDKGIPFNPLDREDPDVTLDASERKIGGLGIYMVKKSMNETQYKRENDMNIFSMTKLW